ncbi:MAG: hypothetical protein R6W75_06780 [Smithellaceae bacterium]
MQTATDMSSFEIATQKDTRALLAPALLTATRRAAKNADWDRVVDKADRMITAAGFVAAVLSALYFAPVLLSILSR